jgi:hypothetical protein
MTPAGYHARMGAAPGWYPVPTGGQRYFDGTGWTEHHHPADGPAERRFTIHYGFVLLAVFSLLGTAIPALALMSTASDPNTQGYGAGMGVLWLVWGGMWTLIWVAFAVQHTLRGRR